MIKKKLTLTQFQILKQLLLQIQDLQSKLNLLLQFLDLPVDLISLELDEKTKSIIIYTKSQDFSTNNNNDDGRTQ